MVAEINIKRGTEAQLPLLGLAEPGFATDTKKLYIGNGVSNVLIGPMEGSTSSGVVSSMPVAQLRSISSFSLTTSYQAISFDTIDVLTELDTLDHDGNLPTRIEIKKSGTYMLNYSLQVESTSNTSEVETKLMANGDTDIPGSYLLQDLYSNEIHSQSADCVAELQEGDYLELYVAGEHTSIQCYAGQMLTVVYLEMHIGVDGEKGDPGPVGSGSSILIKDGNGDYLTNSPNTEIHFSGSGVSVTEGSNNIAEVVIDSAQSVFGTNFGWAEDDTESSTTSSSYQTKLTLISSLEFGTYRIGWSYEYRKSSTNNDFEGRVIVNSADVISEINVESKDSRTYYGTSGFKIMDLNSGDNTIAIQYCVESNSTSYIRKARLEIWRVA